MYILGWIFFPLIGIVTIIAVIKLYLTFSTGWCRSNVCLVGKTVIVTGANAGVGYEAAEDFAKRGARVILACRNAKQANNALEKIVNATNNTNVVFKPLDLSSMKSVRQFAEDINHTEERLDILLNNAGSLYLSPTAMTEDGLLLIMATNYFGHFLLTNLLLDLIKKNTNARIVNVASCEAKRCEPFDLNNLNYLPQRQAWGKRTDNSRLYARTKLCNILFTIELAEQLKGTGVTCYSVHPGIVFTEIITPFVQYWKLPTILLRWFLKNPLEGAQTSIYCSVAKGIEHLSGEHFEECHVIPRYKAAQDQDLPRKLWKASAQLLNLNQH